MSAPCGLAVPPVPSGAGPADHPTPYLRLDLDQVARAYAGFAAELPGVDVHYAVKCNPDLRILQRLHELGGGFEVASIAELDTLVDLGVDPREVLCSNPVKPAAHIAAAARAGVWRFAADSAAELAKLAEHAPGAGVYARLRTAAGGSTVPSEGKFGVGWRQAAELLRAARDAGLRPYGLAFHVGSQMLEPAAWDTAVEESGRVLRALEPAGIRLGMLDLGGGFPARYAGPAESQPPPLSDFAAVIEAAVRRHLPYRPGKLAIEPGRALVAEAGVMVATVIGVAERDGVRWAHLDVGAFNGFMEALESGNRLRFPVGDSRGSDRLARFHLTGPSCDSQDTIMFGVELSADLAVDDRVWLGTAGAYTTSYASAFNGFPVPLTYAS